MATAEAIRQLFSADSPVVADIDSETEDSVIIKGFASVEIEDRSGDIVPPEEFDIEQFMVSPTLLVNHEFWRDSHGNSISVGRIKSAHVARLDRIKDNKEEFAVRDLKTKEIIGTFPRQKIPSLRAGDRGLFVFAEVTQPEVAKMVIRGELGAFSWRGFVEHEFRLGKSNKVQKVLRNIDLAEISLVNIPDNTSSAFTVGKAVHIVKLQKDRFENPGMAKAYLEQHKLKCDRVAEELDSFYCEQLHSSNFDVSKLAVVKMANGVEAIVGTLKRNAGVWSEQPIDGGLLPDLYSSFSDEEIVSKETQMAEEKTTEQVDKEKAMAAFAEVISTKSVEATATVLKPLFEGITDSLKSMSEGIAALLQAGTPEKIKSTDEKTNEKTDETNDIGKQLSAMTESLKKTQEDLVKVAKAALSANEKAEAVGKVTPDETIRDEKLEKTDESKSTDTDPNMVFDSFFDQLV